MVISAAHAIPPIGGAALGKGKTGVIVGAAIGGLVAFASGNPAYVAADLLGVALGTWIGFGMVKKSV